MINLPEGWFVVDDCVHINPFGNNTSWRYIRVQNNYLPSSKVFIYAQEEHNFNYATASEELRKKITEYD